MLCVPVFAVSFTFACLCGPNTHYFYGKSLSGCMSLGNKSCTVLNRLSRPTVRALPLSLSLRYFISARHGWCPGPTQRARSWVKSFTHLNLKTGPCSCGFLFSLRRLSVSKEQLCAWNLASGNDIGWIMTPVRWGKAKGGRGGWYDDKHSQQWNEEEAKQSTPKRRQVSGLGWKCPVACGCFSAKETQHHHVAGGAHYIWVIRCEAY